MRPNHTMRNESPMDRPTILVADDDSDILELLRVLLESGGYEVITVSNGYEALGAAVLRQPDLVVLDVMMPGENGYRVSRALRQGAAWADCSSPPPPVILLTARDLSDDPEREQAFLDFSGANTVIYKPLDFNDVLGRIKELLGGKPDVATPKLFPRLKWTEVHLDAFDREIHPVLVRPPEAPDCRTR